jgi:hypothetical protein
LISENTKDLSISKSALKELGEFLIFAQDTVLKQTPYGNVYNSENCEELEYLQSFGKQLCLEERKGLESFRIAAVTVLINNDLNPHMDLMNPSNVDIDYTTALSYVVPIDKIPVEYREVLNEKYPLGVPLCVVLYRRKCLESLIKRSARWDHWCEEDVHQKVGRRQLVDLMKRTGSYADYCGMFWSKSKRPQLLNDFAKLEVPNSKSKLELVFAKYPEAVDKMVSYIFGFPYHSIHVIILFKILTLCNKTMFRVFLVVFFMCFTYIVGYTVSKRKWFVHLFYILVINAMVR